jgi:hypothetical protein
MQLHQFGRIISFRQASVFGRHQYCTIVPLALWGVSMHPDVAAQWLNKVMHRWGPS